MITLARRELRIETYVKITIIAQQRTRAAPRSLVIDRTRVAFMEQDYEIQNRSIKLLFTI